MGYTYLLEGCTGAQSSFVAPTQWPRRHFRGGTSSSLSARRVLWELLEGPRGLQPLLSVPAAAHRTALCVLSEGSGGSVSGRRHPLCPRPQEYGGCTLQLGGRRASHMPPAALRPGQGSLLIGVPSRWAGCWAHSAPRLPCLTRRPGWEGAPRVGRGVSRSEPLMTMTQGTAVMIVTAT